MPLRLVPKCSSQQNLTFPVWTKKFINIRMLLIWIKKQNHIFSENLHTLYCKKQTNKLINTQHDCKTITSILHEHQIACTPQNPQYDLRVNPYQTSNSALLTNNTSRLNNQHFALPKQQLDTKCQTTHTDDEQPVKTKSQTTHNWSASAVY